MAARDKQEEKGFLSRWSERKRAAEEEAVTPDAAAAADTPQDADADSERIDPAELPDIDSLEAGSDFTVFLRPGVPAALKQRALRRLWQVDPAFKHICMLDDYNLDYTDAATVVPNLKTLYQVGRGMILGDEAETDTASGRPDADTPRKVAEAAPTEEASAAPAESAAAHDEAMSEPAAPQETAQVASAAPPNRRETGPRNSAGRGVRSARQRRWGDSGTH